VDDGIAGAKARRVRNEIVCEKRLPKFDSANEQQKERKRGERELGEILSALVLG
jgi:hypothetical protein